MKHLQYRILSAQAGVIAGLLTGAQAARANDFSDIAENITVSIERLPGLLSGLAYMFGMLLGVLGVMKIKDHVENPSNTPLKDGAVRMAAGGALFALPIVYESMSNTIGATSIGTGPATLSRVTFNVN